jgi:hypothetical protein
MRHGSGGGSSRAAGATTARVRPRRGAGGDGRRHAGGKDLEYKPQSYRTARVRVNRQDAAGVARTLRVAAGTIIRSLSKGLEVV